MKTMLRIINRIAYLTFAFLILVSASSTEARANSYLFRLTGAEIDEIMSRYYPRGYDRDAVHTQMSEPFDCKNFGELCDEVGSEYAYRVVEGAWSRARMEFPIETIIRAMERDVENFSARWLEQRFPLGVPDREPFWGPESVAGGTTCTGSAFAESGNFRVKHTSSRVDVGAVVWGRVKVEHFKRNANGTWKLDRADSLEVEGIVYLSLFENTTALPVSDINDNAKKVAATYFYSGPGSPRVPFVEGCGGTSPNSALWACSCVGQLPSFIP